MCLRRTALLHSISFSVLCFHLHLFQDTFHLFNNNQFPRQYSLLCVIHRIGQIPLLLLFYHDIEILFQDIFISFLFQDYFYFPLISSLTHWLFRGTWFDSTSLWISQSYSINFYFHATMIGEDPWYNLNIFKFAETHFVT